MNFFRVPSTLLLITLVIGISSPGAEAASRPHARHGRMLHHSVERGSVNIQDCFLPRRADTPDELVAQVQASSTLRARYARFFHIQEAAVPDFLRANLRPGQVPKPAKYTMYYVQPTGTIYPTLVTLPQALRIYVRPNGQPFLDAMGNPLRPYRLAEEIVIVTPPDAVAPNTTVIEQTVPTLDVPIITSMPVTTPIYQSPPKPIAPEPMP